jgi:hypothetical protein
MAETKTIKIDVDAKAAIESMDDLTNATKKAGEQFDATASFAERYGEELQPLTTRMGEAEDRLYELANAGQTATQEYQDLLETVGRYRKVQIQTDMAVDAAATTMTQKLGGALGGATAGFELMQGVMGTFGAESEEVEKLLLKVQSAMAISQGVQGVREAIPAITAFGTAIKSQAIAALTTLKGALITTGIGALVVALGFAANAMGLFGDSSEDAEKQQKKLDDQLEKTNKRLEDQKNLTETVSQTLDNRVRRELIDAKKRGASEAELNKIQKEGLKDRIRLLEQEEKANLKLYLQKSKSGSTKEYEAAEAAYKESAQNLIDARLTYDEKEAEITYNRIQENKKLREQDAKDQEFVFTGNVEAFDAAAYDIDVIDNQLYEDMKARDALDIERINADNQLKIDANADLQQALTDAALARIKMEEDAEAEKQRKFKENLKTSLELSIQGLNLIAGIAELNAGEDKKRQKRAFNIKKAANIASATMDGYNAVLSTFAGTTGGVVLKSIAASLAGGFAALQIAGIAKQEFNGGESASGGFNASTPSGGSGGGSVQAPNFNIVGNSGFNQLAQIQQQPIQAYVVSGEVTSAQALDRNRIKNATL